MIRKSVSYCMDRCVPGHFRRTYSYCSLMIVFRKPISCGMSVVGEIYTHCIASFPAGSGLRLKNLGESTPPYFGGEGDMSSAPKVNSPFSTYVARLVTNRFFQTPQGVRPFHSPPDVCRYNKTTTKYK